jgi:hypothetical protein
MSGTIIVPNAVERKKDYIYFINGNGDLCCAPRAKGRTKDKKKVKTTKIKKAKKVIKKVTKKAKPKTKKKR